MFSSGLSKKNTNRLARKQEKALFSSDKVIIHGELEIAIGVAYLARFVHDCDNFIYILNVIMKIYDLKSIEIVGICKKKKRHGISWRKNMTESFAFRKRIFSRFGLTAQRFFIFRRGNAFYFFENAAEVKRIVVADNIGYFIDVVA